MFSHLNLMIIILCILCFLPCSLNANVTYIIYTANINGALENCGCGSNPLGGIGRVKQVIDNVKNDKKQVILIDGGDYFNSYPYPALNEAMLEAFNLIDFDLIVPGEQEFVEGEYFFRKFSKGRTDKILLSNQTSEYLRKKTFQQNGQTLHIYGFLSPLSFDYIAEPDFLLLSSDLTIKNSLTSPETFDILIVHGSKEEAESIVNYQSGFEIVLLAHDQREGVWKYKDTMMIGNGKDSEYLSIIELRSDDGKKIDVSLIPIDQSIPENAEIRQLIDEFNNDNLSN